MSSELFSIGRKSQEQANTFDGDVERSHGSCTASAALVCAVRCKSS
jgi:hypothetical protein